MGEGRAKAQPIGSGRACLERDPKRGDPGFSEDHAKTRRQVVGTIQRGVVTI